MASDGLNRRKFMGKTAAVGLGVLAHPAFSARVFGANDRVVMGIIGSGGRGRGVMQGFVDQGADFAAVSDVYQINSELGLETAGSSAKAYLDYRQLLDRKDIDAVLIATPEHWHHDHLIDAVRAGKDAYCEKPMSHSIEEGADMIKEVRKTDRVAQIGMQRRSSPAVIEAKRIIDEGALGPIDLVRAEWYWNINLHTRPVLADKLDWERFVGPAPKQPFDPVRFRNWRYFWDFSGGNMTDQGTHLIDVVQWFTGAGLAKSAVCFGQEAKNTGSEVPDVFCSVFEYEKLMATWTR